MLGCRCPDLVPSGLFAVYGPNRIAHIARPCEFRKTEKRFDSAGLLQGLAVGMKVTNTRITNPCYPAAPNCGCSGVTSIKRGDWRRMRCWRTRPPMGLKWEPQELDGADGTQRTRRTSADSRRRERLRRPLRRSRLHRTRRRSDPRRHGVRGRPAAYSHLARILWHRPTRTAPSFGKRRSGIRRRLITIREEIRGASTLPRSHSGEG